MISIEWDWVQIKNQEKLQVLPFQAFSGFSIPFACLNNIQWCARGTPWELVFDDVLIHQGRQQLLALTPRAQVPYSPHPHPPLMPPGLSIGWPCSRKTCKLTEFRFGLVWDCSYWSKEAPSMQYITKFHTLFQDFKMFCHLMESTWITPGHWKS